MSDTSKDTLISEHSITGKVYKLMLCNSSTSKSLMQACDKCAFINNTNLCDIGHASCRGTKSYFTESEYQSSACSFPSEQTTADTSKTALNIQVGGEHYKQMKIQPVEYIHANSLSFLEGNVVKYITRHKTKNKAQDIRKIIHYCTLILQLEYNEAYEQDAG